MAALEVQLLPAAASEGGLPSHGNHRRGISDLAPLLATPCDFVIYHKELT